MKAFEELLNCELNVKEFHFYVGTNWYNLCRLFLCFHVISNKTLREALYPPYRSIYRSVMYVRRQTRNTWMTCRNRDNCDLVNNLSIDMTYVRLPHYFNPHDPHRHHRLLQKRTKGIITFTARVYWRLIGLPSTCVIYTGFQFWKVLLLRILHFRCPPVLAIIIIVVDWLVHPWRRPIAPPPSPALHEASKYPTYPVIRDSICFLYFPIGRHRDSIRVFHGRKVTYNVKAK